MDSIISSKVRDRGDCPAFQVEGAIIYTV